MFSFLPSAQQQQRIKDVQIIMDFIEEKLKEASEPIKNQDEFPIHRFLIMCGQKFTNYQWTKVNDIATWKQNIYSYLAVGPRTCLKKNISNTPTKYGAIMAFDNSFSVMASVQRKKVDRR